MKYILTVFILLFFTSCAGYKTQNFYINNELEIENEKLTYTTDTCTSNSFYSNYNHIKYGQLYVEYISLQTNCDWNGYQRGYFEYLYKKTLGIKSMKKVRRINHKSYEFSTYLIDGKYYMDLIYNYDIGSDTFIVDSKGLLAQTLIRQFDENYISEHINKLRFNKEYKNSLVKTNFYNDYFERERLILD